MKFDLTIRDASFEEINEVLGKLNAAVPAAIVAAPSPLETPVFNPPSATTVQFDRPEPVAQPVNAGERDADGLTWDERIHSSNREKNKQGFWRRKRGLQDVEYDRVKAEMLGVPQQFAAPVHIVTPSLPPMPTAPYYMAPPGGPDLIAQPQTHAVPAPDVALSSAPRDFNFILTRIQQGFQSGKCTPNYIPNLVQKINQTYGTNLSAITDVNGDFGLTGIVHGMMDQDGL